MNKQIDYYNKYKKSYLNCSFKVIKGDNYFQTGEIYNVVDGYLFNPRVMRKLPTTIPPFRTFRELQMYFSCETPWQNKPLARWDTAYTVEIEKI